MSNNLKRKHIAFIIPSLQSGGAERVVSTLANSLINSFDVTLIVIYKGIPFYELDSKINIIYCFATYEAKSKVLASLSMHVKLNRKIVNTIKVNNISTIIGFMTTANIHAIIASKFTKTKSIISERANPLHDEVNKLWQKARRWLYPKSDMLVIQTNDVKSLYKSFVPDSKLCVISNPISEDLLQKVEPKAIKENLIISVGRLDDGKNHELLINAFSKINSSGWIVNIIGDGPKKDSLQHVINSLGLSKSVTLIGRTKTISDFYNKASLFVLTSNHEGFPNALIEAMHFNMACISTNCQFGPSELITDGVNGYLIPLDDQLALQNRLELLINDAKLRSQLQTNTAKNLDQYSVATIANQWKTLIETC